MSERPNEPRVNAQSWTGDDERQALPYAVIRDPSSPDAQLYALKRAGAALAAMVLLFILAGIARYFGWL